MIDQRGRKVLDYSELSTKQLNFFLKYIWNGVGSREYIRPPQFIFSEASKSHDFFFFFVGEMIQIDDGQIKNFFIDATMQ